MSTDYKDLFIPTSEIYLLNHAVGRPPVSTQQAWAAGFLSPWEQDGESVWPKWLESIWGFRSALADLLNGQASEFCPQTNLSGALTKVLYSLPKADNRSTILYSEQDFPSIAYVLQKAESLGYKLKAVSDDSDLASLDAWTAALTDEVAIALITHVQSNTGKQVPVSELTRIARERGVISIVDVAQSVGCVPIDLCQWSADFVIGSCVKWLCGGPGAGFLWCSSDIIDQCKPVDVGWFSHEDPFEFEINSFRYAKDALRFWGGTPSVQPFSVAANSIATIHTIGVENIRDHNLALTQCIIDRVPRECIVTPTEKAHRGGSLVLALPLEQQNQFERKLREASVLFDTRPTGIRISPHIYNDAAEIEVVLDCFE
ncbi:MAG: aminotransferase class V-fold PLP-dependent enzyme [Halioglobus sp.]